MIERPCKPGEDLKRLWRTLLPGTPFPVCGTAPDEEGDRPAEAAETPATPPEPVRER